jgi:hypothetical protein
MAGKMRHNEETEIPLVYLTTTCKVMSLATLYVISFSFKMGRECWLAEKRVHCLILFLISMVLKIDEEIEVVKAWIYMIPL